MQCKLGNFYVFNILFRHTEMRRVTPGALGISFAESVGWSFPKDGTSLPAARQLSCLSVDHAFKPQKIADFFYLKISFRLSKSVNTADKLKIFPNRKPRGYGGLLGRYADLSLDLLRLLCNGSAAYSGISRCRFCQTGQHFYGRGLSCTIYPKQGK